MFPSAWSSTWKFDDGSESVSQQHYINEARDIPKDKFLLMNKWDLVDEEYKKYRI